MKYYKSEDGRILVERDGTDDVPADAPIEISEKEFEQLHVAAIEGSIRAQ